MERKKAIHERSVQERKQAAANATRRPVSLSFTGSGLIELVVRFPAHFWEPCERKARHKPGFFFIRLNS